MDRLESLGNSLSQITLYDIKSMYNQVRVIAPSFFSCVLALLILRFLSFAITNNRELLACLLVLSIYPSILGGCRLITRGWYNVVGG